MVQHATLLFSPLACVALSASMVIVVQANVQMTLHSEIGNKMTAIQRVELFVSLTCKSRGDT